MLAKLWHVCDVDYDDDDDVDDNEDDADDDEDDDANAFDSPHVPCQLVRFRRRPLRTHSVSHSFLDDAINFSTDQRRQSELFS